MEGKSTHTSGGRDVATVFATQAVAMVFGIVIQSLLAHVLQPDGRGVYAVSIALSAVLAVLCTPGSNTGTQYFVMAGKVNLSSGVSTAAIIGTVGSGLAILLAWPLLSGALPYSIATDARKLALVLIPINTFATTIDLLLTGLRKFKLLGMLTLVRSAVHALILLLLLGVSGAGVDGAIVALAVGYSVLIVAAVYYLVRQHRLALQVPALGEFRAILGYGFRYHAARVGSVVGRNAGVLLLGLVAVAAEAGLFAAANALMARFGTIGQAVGNALLSRVAVGEDGRPDLVGRCVRTVGLVTAAAVGVFAAVSPPVIRVLLSDAFLPAGPLIWIMAPGVIATATSGILTVYLRGTDRPQLCSWSVWIGLAVNAALLVMLYPALGVRAAAFAFTAAALCRNLFLDVAYRRAARASWRSLWIPRPDDVGFLRSALVSALRSPGVNA